MTYLYETIPSKKGEEAKQFEIKQSANDAPLTKHPETGEPIRRVILGGWGLVSNKANAGGSSKGGCGCGPSQSCG
jgi:predicted nucleic acid-binding Zn ribbon protein